jgi:histone H3/H4
MENGSFKLLESATQRTLHAQNFTRTSTQASIVLTDLLSRYIALLANTCAKYASQAGRSNLTTSDAISALQEAGLSMEDLADYARSEGREMARYTVHTARRMEDMSEYKSWYRSVWCNERISELNLVLVQMS